MSTELADAKAREQALDLSINALVMAPAGSGKTGLLVQRMLCALAVVEQPEQVVAITFTRKAAAEIRSRVLQALADAEAQDAPSSGHEAVLFRLARAVLDRDRERNWKLQAHPARLNATTIDSFCAQLAAQSPLLSGLGGSLGIVEDAQPLYEQAIVRLFEELEDESVPQADRDALSRVLRLSANRLDQLIAPMAGLLSVRDRWMGAAHRDDVEYWANQDERVLEPLWSSARAKLDAILGQDDKQTLLECLKQGAGQSQLLGWASSLTDWPNLSSEQLRLLMSTCLTKDRKKLRSRVNVRDGFISKQPYTQRFNAWLASQQDNTELLDLARDMAGLPDVVQGENLVELRAAWLRVLRRLAAHLKLVFSDAQQTDFVELSQAALAALNPSADDIGDALLKADQRIQHLLVDEMQDTSEVQLRLLKQLSAGWQPGDGRSMFLVGDPQQSIYGFRNAQVRLFLDLWESQKLAQLRLVPLRLSANFRSATEVVEWFNRTFSEVFPARIDVSRGAVPFAASQPIRGPQALAGVSVHAFAEAETEAQFIADQAAQVASPETTVAILARTKSRLEPIIRQLRARGLTPSCQDLDPLAALPEVRDVIALARALWHPQDRLSWAVLLRAPFVGLSWQAMVNLSVGRRDQDWPTRISLALVEGDRLDSESTQRLERLMRIVRETEQDVGLSANIADRCEAVWRALAGPLCCSRPALDDVRRALQCLRMEAPGGNLRDLAQLQRRLEQLFSAPRKGQVQMMTVHKAKGLEFDHVLIAGANARARNDDRPPIYLETFPQGQFLVPRPDEAWPAEDSAHLSYEFLAGLGKQASHSELLRLVYVAVTRARQRAQICMTVERDKKTGQVKFEPGSFAGALAPAIRYEVEQSFENCPPVEPSDAAPVGLIAARLPLETQLPIDSGLYRPPEIRSLRPSESVLIAREDQAAEEGENLYAQLVGTLYHEAMQRIAQEGIERWQDAGQSRSAAMASGLRRRGMPEPMVASAVARVIELLGSTLNSSQGRWLLEPKAWARSEYALAGRSDGRWVSAVIDRCFEDADGCLWVVDYKTSASPVVPEAQAEYLASGREKYRDQLARYGELMAQLHPGRKVRAALYFADPDHLMELAA